VLHDSKSPCILRRLDGEYADNEYRIISQCYLEGLMYGDNPEPTIRWWKHEPQQLCAGMIDGLLSKAINIWKLVFLDQKLFTDNTTGHRPEKGRA
jgi:hypothetical protein